MTGMHEESAGAYAALYGNLYLRPRRYRFQAVFTSVFTSIAGGCMIVFFTAH